MFATPLLDKNPYAIQYVFDVIKGHGGPSYSARRSDSRKGKMV